MALFSQATSTVDPPRLQMQFAPASERTLSDGPQTAFALPTY